MAAQGERVLICKRNRPVVELHAVAVGPHGAAAHRPRRAGADVAGCRPSSLRSMPLP